VVDGKKGFPFPLKTINIESSRDRAGRPGAISQFGGWNVAQRVMLVDDASFMRMMLKNILVGAGYEVIGEAENGAKAIEQFKTLKPDLVIMDIIMPEMGGIDAVREIMKANPSAKVLMCSSMGQQSLVVEAIQAGAKDFIVKPFQPSNVLEAVKKALG
jgi:two-component system chemotaxis response regulator CheY